MEDLEFHLIRAIAGGEDAAFEELVKRYQAPIITFIYRHVGDLYSARTSLRRYSCGYFKRRRDSSQRHRRTALSVIRPKGEIVEVPHIRLGGKKLGL